MLKSTLTETQSIDLNLCNPRNLRHKRMELKNINRFEELVNTVPAKISALTEKEMAHRPAPNKWSNTNSTYKIVQ